jgi:DNA-binding LacI/PurR family transcriptional regulator
MADVAREGKVHQTTVSLALRNDPRLPAETRERLRDLAERMGYRPDPMLSALNIYRSSRAEAKARPSMALLTRARNKVRTFYCDDQVLKGARRACERLGYRLATFAVGDGDDEGPRLSRILRSRGITGVIVATLDVGLRQLDMEWEHFSALCIESQHLGLSFHMVGNDQMAITRRAVRRIRELGYRRIGLCVGSLEEASLRKPFTGGYLLEMHENPDLSPAPPLLLDNGEDADVPGRLASWIRLHRLDAVMSNWSTVPRLLESAGLRVPKDLGVATLDYNPNRGAFAGIRQSHQIVGERAVEALALMMKTNQTGPLAFPNTTLIDGVWEDGPELPGRLR